jgi:hypothetical protein
MKMMTDENPMAEDMKVLEPLKDTPIAPAHGIAALALNMALKWHDMSLVKDGAEIVPPIWDSTSNPR